MQGVIKCYCWMHHVFPSLHWQMGKVICAIFISETHHWAGLVFMGTCGNFLCIMFIISDTTELSPD